MSLAITLSIAAAAAIINIWLMIRVGQVRTSEEVSVGDGGNDKVIRRMRAHANFGESAPIVLVLIAALELTGGSSLWLWCVGILYIFGRVAHAFGMEENGFAKGRFIGTIISLLVQLGLTVMALYTVYTVYGMA